VAYVAYEQYAGVVIPQMAGWFRKYLAGGPIDMWETTDAGETYRTVENAATEGGRAV